MRVLIITGDKRFGPGHPRYELQRATVEQLEVLYWGRGSMWPKIPAGNFDVVTVQDPFWRGLFAWRVARRLGAKFNVQVHTDLSVQSFLKHIVGQMVLRHADSVRVVSEKIKKQVEAFGVQTPIHILPVFVDLAQFRQVRREPQRSILWVGRFEEEKDPLCAIEIAKHVGAPLVMLGAGTLENQVRTTASRSNLDIVLPGWQDPLPYLSCAGVLLSTSRHESWGQSMIEALAAGVPVVAPDVGIAREAGATVVPRTKLADAVREVLQSGARGELKLALPTKEEWARAWKESLQ